MDVGKCLPELGQRRLVNTVNYLFLSCYNDDLAPVRLDSQFRVLKNSVLLLDLLVDRLLKNVKLLYALLSLIYFINKVITAFITPNSSRFKVKVKVKKVCP